MWIKELDTLPNWAPILNGSLRGLNLYAYIIIEFLISSELYRVQWSFDYLL